MDQLRRMGVAGWVVGLALLIGLPGLASAGGPVHQGAYQATVAGPLDIGPDESPPPFVTLAVPSGRWLAWAQVRTRVTGGVNHVTCWLTARSRPLSDRHVGRTAVGNVGYPDEKSLLVTVSIAKGAAADGATFALRCTAPLPATAHGMRIVAMRVGRLTQVALATGSETITGTGTPRVIQGRRSGFVDLEAASSLGTIASLPLPAGRWWVRANLTVQTVTQSVGTPTNGFECRLVAGGEVDGTEGVIVGEDGEHSKEMVALELAVTTTTATEVRVRCAQDSADDPVVRARDIRITAVRAGRLTIGQAVVDGATTTIGSGTPRVIHGERAGPVAVSGSTPWSTLGLMTVPAGRWIVTAKFDHVEGYGIDRLDCRLTVGPSTDTLTTYAPFVGTALPFTVLRSVREPTVARVACHQGRDPEEWALARSIRLTALRID